MFLEQITNKKEPAFERPYYITSDKQLCVLQFNAHKALHVVDNVGVINMIK